MNAISLNTNELTTESATEAYINSFKAAFSKTAKSVLEIGKIVYEAKLNLKEEQFDLFALKVGFKSGTSTIIKLLAIGSKYDFLIERIDLLPASWTTLYDIAQLPVDQFEKCVDEGVIKPNLKGKDIKPFLPNYNPSKPKSSSSVPNGNNKTGGAGEYKFVVTLAGFPDEATVKKLKKIIDECKSIQSVAVDMSTLEEFFTPETIEAEVA